MEHNYQGSCPDGNQPDARDASCPACQALGPPDDCRTIARMAPLTREQIQDRMRQVDHALIMVGKEYGDTAAAWIQAKRAREHAIAVAYGEATGQPTDRKMAATAAVGMQGVAEEKAHAKVLADYELHRDRQIGLASMLKAARAEDDERRYAEGP